MKPTNFTGKNYTGHIPAPLRPVAKAIGWLKKQDAPAAEAPAAAHVERGLTYFPFIKRVVEADTTGPANPAAALSVTTPDSENGEAIRPVPVPVPVLALNTATSVVRNAPFNVTRVAEPVYPESWVPALKKLADGNAAAHDAGKRELKEKLTRILPSQTTTGVTNLMRAARDLVPSAVDPMLDMLEDFCVSRPVADKLARDVIVGLSRFRREPNSSGDPTDRIDSLRVLHQLRRHLAGEDAVEDLAELSSAFVDGLGKLDAARQALRYRALMLALCAAPAAKLQANAATAQAIVRQLTPQQNAALVHTIAAMLREERDGTTSPAISGKRAVMALLSKWANVADGRAADIDALANELRSGRMKRDALTARLRELEENIREFPEDYKAAAGQLAHIRKLAGDEWISDMSLGPLLEACADDVRKAYRASPRSAAWDDLQSIPRELLINSVADAPPAGKIKRAPVDILVHWTSDVEKKLADGSLSQDHAHLLSDAGTAFFSGARSAEDIKMVLDQAAQYCTANNLGAQPALLDMLIPQLPDAAYIGTLWSQRKKEVTDEFERALSEFSPAQRDRSPATRTFFAEAQRFLNDARAGRLSTKQIGRALTQIHAACANGSGDAKWSDLAKLARRLAGEVDHHTVLLEGPLLHGAAASRVFETAFVADLLDQTMPDGFSRSMERIGAQLERMLRQTAPDRLDELIEDVQASTFFIDGKTSSSLKDASEAAGVDAENALYRFLGEPKADGYQCAALMYVARNAVLRAYPYHSLGNPEWMSDRVAYQKFLPKLTRVKANGAMPGNAWRNAHPPAGLTLPHQPAVAHFAGVAGDTRPLTRYNPDFSAPALDHPLHNGEVHVASVSGSALTLLFMLDAFKKDDPDIDIRAGVLSMLMYMVHMGGHSMYEIMWVVQNLQPLLGLDVGYVDQNGNFEMDFGKLLHISDDPAWRTMLGNAAQAGWEKTITYHREHSEFGEKQI